MIFEKPQKGNPHQLVIKQHVFPVASIERFAALDGCVRVVLLKCGEIKRLKPNNSLFCAQRSWDDSIERGRIKKIEDKFQVIASRLVGGHILVVDDVDNDALNEFYAIWSLRFHRRANPISDVVINIVSPSKNYTKDQLEKLEKHGIIGVRPDGSLPGRQIAGVQLSLDIDRMRNSMANVRWGVLRSENAEFLVPDNYFNAAIIPLAPNMCLSLQGENKTITDEEVREVNRLAIQSSRDYFFARDLAKCPQ